MESVVLDDMLGIDERYVKALENEIVFLRASVG